MWIVVEPVYQHRRLSLFCFLRACRHWAWRLIGRTRFKVAAASGKACKVCAREGLFRSLAVQVLVPFRLVMIVFPVQEAAVGGKAYDGGEQSVFEQARHLILSELQFGANAMDYGNRGSFTSRCAAWEGGGRQVLSLLLPSGREKLSCRRRDLVASHQRLIKVMTLLSHCP